MIQGAYKTWGRYALVGIAVGVVALMRGAPAARSAVITSSAADKLTVYSGVLMIIPDATGALELGNTGRDIISTREVFFRPGATLEGSKFYQEPPVCSADGKQCLNDGDCLATIDPKTGHQQTCLNNIQNLSLTGNLIVDGQLCFQQGTNAMDCLGSWPEDASVYWSPIEANSLHPVAQSNGTHDAIRIGDSWGHCLGDMARRCIVNTDCVTPQTCSVYTYNGVTGRDTLLIQSNTTTPALSVTHGATFGELDFAKQGSLTSGATLVFGSVYVDGTVTIMDRLDNITHVWSGATPTDTQDGLGISADTFSGTTKLPFSVAGQLIDLHWWQYYKNPNGKSYPGVSTTETGGGISPMLCAHVDSQNGYACLNGANAGKQCSSNTDCVANEACTSNVCSITKGPCVTASDCPGNTTHPASVANAKCQKLCDAQQGQCTVDNLMYCSGNTALTCTGNADCTGFGSCVENVSKLHCTFQKDGVYPPCSVDADCNPEYYGEDKCIPGQLFASPSCTNASCATLCQGKKKCSGGAAADAECKVFGTDINYNVGTCVNDHGNQFCRCSLNVREVTSLPYILVKGGLEGEVCSLPFDIANQSHPAVNP